MQLVILIPPKLTLKELMCSLVLAAKEYLIVLINCND